jgi:hypothetical protein
MGGVHLPKYLLSPISSATAAHEDSCLDESGSPLYGRVDGEAKAWIASDDDPAAGTPGSGRWSLTRRGAQGPGDFHRPAPSRPRAAQPEL